MGFFPKLGGSKKNSAASQAFKQKMGAKLGVEQSFQKRLDAAVEKDIGDYMKARTASAAARGQQGPLPEISKSAKTMLTMLASKKVQKEIKKEKAAAAAEAHAKKKAQQAVETAKRNAQYQADLKARELEAQQQASSKSYFFGYTEE